MILPLVGLQIVLAGPIMYANKQAKDLTTAAMQRSQNISYNENSTYQAEISDFEDVGLVQTSKEPDSNDEELAVPIFVCNLKNILVDNI